MLRVTMSRRSSGSWTCAEDVAMTAASDEHAISGSASAEASGLGRSAGGTAGRERGVSGLACSCVAPSPWTSGRHGRSLLVAARSGTHLGLLAGDDLVLGRQLPQLALERAERLLARLVEELDVRLAVLALVGAVVEAPRLDLGEQVAPGRRGARRARSGSRWRGGSRRSRPAGKRWKSSSGSVEAPCWTAPARPYVRATSPKPLERAEVELDLRHAATGQRHAAVAGARLDAHLGRGPMAPGPARRRARAR